MTTGDLSRLAEECLTLMTEEESALAALLDCAKAFRSGLARSGSQELEHSLRCMNQAVCRVQAIVPRLLDFRPRAAGLLGVAPESVTVRRLADALPPPLAGRLLDARARVERLVAETQRVQRANAFLAQYGRETYQGLVAAVTGGRRSGVYSRGGKPAGPAGRPLIEVRG